MYQEQALTGVAQHGLDDAAIDRHAPHPGALGVGLGGQVERVQRRGDGAGGTRVRVLLGRLAAGRIARLAGARRERLVTERRGHRLEGEQHRAAVEAVERDGEARAQLVVAERRPHEPGVEVALQQGRELARVVGVLDLRPAGERRAFVDRGDEQRAAGQLHRPAAAVLGGLGPDLLEQRAEPVVGPPTRLQRVRTPGSQALGLALALLSEKGHTAANQTG